MTDRKQDPPSDASRTDPETADKNRGELKKKVEQGTQDASGNLPKDQI